MLLSLITSLNMTVASIVTAIRNRPRCGICRAAARAQGPAQVLVDTVANKHIEHVQRTEQRRASRASDFDLPVDDPPLPEQPEKKTAGRKNAPVRPDVFVENSRRQEKAAEAAGPNRSRSRRRLPRRRRSSRLSITITERSLTR